MLMKPLTYMNLSGEAIKAFLDARGIRPEEMLVICDDVNLDFGRIRIRKSGSSGGHKGLKSIIEHVHTDGFPRLRIGIGKQTDTGDLTEYVLDTFTKPERNMVDKMLDVTADAILLAISDGIDIAMSRFNTAAIT
jgi:PTH1 family peptidyl-tRNA hydrolase